jgi:hypothetical protein
MNEMLLVMVCSFLLGAFLGWRGGYSMGYAEGEATERERKARSNLTTP